jgi:hypothetical protein
MESIFAKNQKTQTAQIIFTQRPKYCCSIFEWPLNSLFIQIEIFKITTVHTVHVHGSMGKPLKKNIPEVFALSSVVSKQKALDEVMR